MKHRSIALLAILAALTSAATAHATTLTDPAGQPVGGWTQACANRNTLPAVPQVTIDNGNPLNVAATAYTVEGTTMIYLPAEWPGANCGDVLHELGHQFDYWRMTDSDRSHIMRALHLRGEWRQTRNSPHEQFAELYRIAATHSKLPRYGSVAYGLHPTPRAFVTLRQWLLHASHPLTSPDATA